MTFNVFSADGTFSLKGIYPTVQQTIEVEAEGFFPARRSITTQKSDKDRTILFALAPSSGISGKVVDKYTGAPIASAFIGIVENPSLNVRFCGSSVKSEGRNVHYGWIRDVSYKQYVMTDENGEFMFNEQIEGGRIYVYAESYGPQAVDLDQNSEVLNIGLTKAAVVDLFVEQLPDVSFNLQLSYIEMPKDEFVSGKRFQYLYALSPPTHLSWQVPESDLYAIRLAYSNASSEHGAWLYQAFKKYRSSVVSQDQLASFIVDSFVNQPPAPSPVAYTLATKIVDKVKGDSMQQYLIADSSFSGIITEESLPKISTIHISTFGIGYAYDLISETDPKGQFKFPAIPQGEYKVTIWPEGGDKYEEKVVVDAPLKRNFDLPSSREKHRVFGKVVPTGYFAERMMAATNNRVYIHLQMIEPLEDSTEHLDLQGEEYLSWREDGLFSFKGIFKGKYRLYLEGINPTQRYILFPEVSLDCEIEDQDLGDIPFFVNNATSLVIAIDNWEFHEKTFVDSLFVSKSDRSINALNCATFNTMTGDYTIQGMTPGNYIILLQRGRDWDEKAPILFNRNISVTGPMKITLEASDILNY